MGTTYMDFGSGVFHVDGDAPLTQAQVDSVWRNLPTTGASWVKRGHLFVQQFDGAKAFDLGPVDPGVKGVSDKVRLGGQMQRHHATKKSPARIQREIDEVLAGKRTGSVSRSTKKRASQPRTVSKHGLGTADVRTGEGAYWIVTVPTGYRVDYKPWGPSNEVDLGTFKSRTKARTKITTHARSLGATIVS